MSKENREDREKGNFLRKALFHAKQYREYVLVCCVFFLCLCCALLDRFLLGHSNEFLGVLIFEIVVFLIPVFVYFTLNSKTSSVGAFAKEFNITKISHRLVFLPAVATFLMIFGSLILDIMFFGVYDITDGFALYGYYAAQGDGSAVSNIYLILTFAVLPGIFEEIVFRKLLMQRHTNLGVVPAVIISAFFYALTPFSLRLFPSFFFSGIIYCVIFIFTGSLVTSISAHILFNLYGLYLRTNIANFFISTGDAYMLVILSIVLFLASAILFVGLLYKMFLNLAKAGKTPPALGRKGERTSSSLKALGEIFKVPSNIITLVIYLAYVIIFGFFSNY